MYAVQYFSIIVFFLISLCALSNFKKTVLVWIPIHVLFNAQVAIRYSPPGISLVVSVNIMLIILYFILRSVKSNNYFNQEPFILLAAMWITIISYLLSIFFSQYPVNSGITKMLREFISGFAMIFLLQRVLVSKKDFYLFLKSSIVVIFLITSLGLFEFIFKDNPILDWVYLNSPHDVTTFGRMHYAPPFLIGESETRYGMIRANSFFGIHISFGVACVFFLYLIGTLYKRLPFAIPKYWLIIILLLLVLGVITSNSKAPMLGLIVLSLCFLKPSQIISMHVIVLLSIALLLIVVYVPDYLNNLISLFDSSVAEEGQGSTVDLRQRQFEVALNLFQENPLFGNGVGSIDVMKNFGYNAEIYGAESIWLQILPERGLFGVFAYIFMIYSLFKAMNRSIPFREAFFCILCYFTIESVTGYSDFGLYGCMVISVIFLYKHWNLETLSR